MIIILLNLYYPEIWGEKNNIYYKKDKKYNIYRRQIVKNLD